MSNSAALQATKEQMARARLMSLMGDASGGLQFVAPVLFIVESPPPESAEPQTAYRTVCSSFDVSFQATGSLATAIARTMLRQIDSLVTIPSPGYLFVTASSEPAPQAKSPLGAVETIQSVLNLTRGEIAELIGVARQTLHAWSAGADVQLRKTSSYQSLAKLAEIAKAWSAIAGSDIPVPRWSLNAVGTEKGMLAVLRAALREGKDPSSHFQALSASMRTASERATQREAESPRKLTRRTKLQVLAESIERAGGGGKEG
jgi:hypothetical protein